VLPRRPEATKTSSIVTSRDAPFFCSMRAIFFAPSRRTDFTAQLVSSSMPSLDRSSRTRAITSASSLLMISSSISTTVTREPKRANICANSMPM
jgi:hypothetical protein